MRQRVVYLLTWLLAATAATSVGFAATILVGDVVRGTGPVGFEYDPAKHQQPISSGKVVTKTFNYPAVELVVECNDRVAHLIRTTPTPGWELANEEVGPDEDLDVTLTRGSAHFEVEVYCNEGVPRGVLTNKPAAPDHARVTRPPTAVRTVSDDVFRDSAAPALTGSRVGGAP